MSGCGFPAWRWRARANVAPGVGGLRPCAGGGGLLGHGARLRERALRARRHAHPPRPARGLGSRRARGVDTRLLARRTSRAVTRRRRASHFFAVRSIIRDFIITYALPSSCDFKRPTTRRAHRALSRRASTSGRPPRSTSIRSSGSSRAPTAVRSEDDGRRRSRARRRAVTPPCRRRAAAHARSVSGGYTAVSCTSGPFSSRRALRRALDVVHAVEMTCRIRSGRLNNYE